MFNWLYMHPPATIILVMWALATTMTLPVLFENKDIKLSVLWDYCFTTPIKNGILVGDVLFVLGMFPGLIFFSILLFFVEIFVKFMAKVCAIRITNPRG